MHQFKHFVPVAPSQDSVYDKRGVSRVQQVEMFGMNMPSNDEQAKMVGQYLLNKQMEQNIQATLGGGQQYGASGDGGWQGGGKGKGGGKGFAGGRGF